MKNLIVNFRTKTLSLLLAFLLICAVFISIIEKEFLQATFPIITFISFSTIVVFSILVTYIILRNYFKDLINASYGQLESLLSIIPIVNPRLPMPSTRGWAASPDLLSIIIENIIIRKPKTILELGGGVSTIYIGYILEKNKYGKVYSIDHLNEFAHLTNNRIKEHLLDQYAEVIDSPLEQIQVNGKEWMWYKHFMRKEIEKIDMLIIDGPPKSIQINSRYPAIPLLFEYLADNAIVIIDDCIRKEDKETVYLWLKEYPELKLNEINTEKGTMILIVSKST